MKRKILTLTCLFIGLFVKSQPPPQIVVNGGGQSFQTLVGIPSTVQTWLVSGNYLTGSPGNITVTAPAGMEVSLSSSTGYAGTLQIPYTSSDFK